MKHILIMIVGLAFVSGFAATETVNGITWTYTVNNGKATVGDGGYGSTAISELTSGAVTIPSKLGGYSVTSIGGYAFYCCRGLASVTIPNSVTSIGGSAFYGCSGLTSVTIGNGVTSIGAYAFYNCSGLTSVVIPDSIKSIGDGAFNSTPFYNNQPEGLVILGKIVHTIKGVCPSVVIIPSDVTGIGDNAFSCCSGLTSVTIPNSVTSIGQAAFYGCSGLTSVTIPDSVTSIERQAFAACSGLTSVTIPNSVTNIGALAFADCPMYEINLCRMVWGGTQYTLASAPADRAIASVTVDRDCAIDDFVLQDGKVYDSVLYISNAVDRVVTLTLPAGYTYKTRRGARPLVIPESAQCILSITRLADRVFLVSREDLDTVE